MKKFILLLLPFSLVSCGQKENTKTIYVQDVHDGDTLTDSAGTRYRILGADTPEVSSGQQFLPTTGLESIYGQMATDFTRNLLLHKNVRIRVWKDDKYNRKVAQFFINDNNDTLSYELIKRGLARVAYITSEHTNSKYYNAPDYYFADQNYIRKLYDAQLYAASNNLGFWKDRDMYNIIFPKA